MTMQHDRLHTYPNGYSSTLRRSVLFAKFTAHVTDVYWRPMLKIRKLTWLASQPPVLVADKIDCHSQWEFQDPKMEVPTIYKAI